MSKHEIGSEINHIETLLKNYVWPEQKRVQAESFADDPNRFVWRILSIVIVAADLVAYLLDVDRNIVGAIIISAVLIAFFNELDNMVNLRENNVKDHALSLTHARYKELTANNR